MDGAARSRTLVAIVLAAGALWSAGPGLARAASPIGAIENATVTSFDGTPIVVNFFPAAGLSTGETAPTVLEGPAWGSPAYPDWLPTVGALSIGPVGFGGNLLGPATLIADGYNVVTWDSRGWFASGGQVQVDSPYYEGRDVTAIINWLATLPGVKLKGPNDPVVGMTGASYGGGIQLSTAALDHRLDAIEPNMSWYSLVDALYPNQVIKQGWGNLLCWSGELEGARYAPDLTDICNSADSGVVTQQEIEEGEQASPGSLIGDITTPTLLLGGTVDTLFPLNGDVDTYDALRAAGTPVQMIWYCGGHGNCNLPAGPYDYVTNIELAFLNRYLKGDHVSTGPGFQYLDQTGTWRSAPAYPPPVSGEVTGQGSGQLHLNPSDSSGLFIAATEATNALDIPIAPPRATVDTLSDPRLTLTYEGTGSRPAAPIFAQLVDTSTGTVLDNQATPVQLTLDGRSHAVTVPLNMVVWGLNPSSRITLQLTDASNLYFEQQATGLVHLTGRLVWPTSAPGPTS